MYLPNDPFPERCEALPQRKGQHTQQHTPFAAAWRLNTFYGGIALQRSPLTYINALVCRREPCLVRRRDAAIRTEPMRSTLVIELFGMCCTRLHVPLYMEGGDFPTAAGLRVKISIRLQLRGRGWCNINSSLDAL